MPFRELRLLRFITSLNLRGGDGRKTDRIFRGLSLVRKLCFNLFIFGQRREFLFSGEIPEV